MNVEHIAEWRETGNKNVMVAELDYPLYQMWRTMSGEFIASGVHLVGNLLFWRKDLSGKAQETRLGPPATLTRPNQQNASYVIPDTSAKPPITFDIEEREGLQVLKVENNNLIEFEKLQTEQKRITIYAWNVVKGGYTIEFTVNQPNKNEQKRRRLSPDAP